ncbi:MAG: hypothetical protein Q9165_008654 [Trypethelium subeluteriae]
MGSRPELYLRGPFRYSSPNQDAVEVTFNAKEAKPDHVILRQAVLKRSDGKLGISLPPRFPFLKLPAELRLQVYGYLFPNKPIPHSAEIPLRENSEPCHMEILRVNRFIYEEATEVLYGTVPFCASFECCGCSGGFLRSPWHAEDGHQPNHDRWQVLSHVRHLRITISAHRSFRVESNLSLQHALFDLVDALGQSDRLRRLEIEFFYEPDEEWEFEADDLQEFLEDAHRDDTGYEKYGEIVDQQHFAFFLEPFYQLRNLTQLGERNGFEVRFENCKDLPTLQPFLNELKALMKSSDPITATWPLRNAWNAFKALFMHLSSKVTCPDCHILYALSRTMQFALLRGNVGEYVTAQKRALSILTKPKNRTIYVPQADTREERADARERNKDFNTETARLLKEARANAARANDTTFSLTRLIQEEQEQKKDPPALTI